MKLYLDMCCLKHPFDDQADPRVQMETLAVETTLVVCREGLHELITSDALRFENSRNPNLERRDWAVSLLALAVHDVIHSPVIEATALEWQKVGVALLDSLHLASAELAGADCFASCDDVLLSRAARAGRKLRIEQIVDLYKELLP